MTTEKTPNLGASKNKKAIKKVKLKKGSIAIVAIIIIVIIVKNIFFFIYVINPLCIINCGFLSF